jgi:6,7-dimethyl-8-ribityllumazine synthase
MTSTSDRKVTSTPIVGEFVKKSSTKIGIVTALFNSEVTLKLETGALQALEKAGYSPHQVVTVRVAGAFEVPLALKALLESGMDGVVALAAVIRGDTAHFEYVCRSVERGCSQLQLDYLRPVGFGVLTTDTEEQAQDRAGGKMGNKGFEAAQVVVEMLDVLKKIKASQTLY